MSRYIDKETLLSGIYSDNPDDVMAYIAEYPTVDAVEVVRCKECIHMDLVYDYCHEFDWAVDENGYCYMGEREDE